MRHANASGPYEDLEGETLRPPRGVLPLFPQKLQGKRKSESTELVKFLSDLRVTQGPRAGEYFTVLPWQKRFCRGFLSSQVSALSVARGNGKTTLLAGIAAAALSGPLARERGEVLLIAGAFSQAKISFDHVLNFLNPGERRYRILDSTGKAEIQDRDTGAKLICAGATPRLAHGRAPHLILGDEPSSWLHTQSEKMVAALLTGLGKHSDSRCVFLGTRPGSPDHFFEKMLQGNADFSACYATPKELYEHKPFTMAAIRKANPSLDHMPDLRAAIMKDAERAKKDGSLLPAYLALRLNAGVSETVEAVLLEAGTWERIEGTAAPADGPTVWGVDLSTSAAQSAVSCFWPQTGRLEALSAFPAVPNLKSRGTTDGAGTLYEVCFKRGELIIAGNHTVDVPELLRVALARFGVPSQLVCDRWRAADLREACEKAEIPLCRVVHRGMGFKEGAEDVRNFRKACLDGKVTPVPSLLLRSAMSVSRTTSDPAGNAKLAKAGEGKRPGARDDAAAASVLAVSSGMREPPAATPTRVYKGMT